MVQFYPWFKFYSFFGGTVKYEEIKENEIGTKDKLNHTTYIHLLLCINNLKSIIQVNTFKFIVKAKMCKICCPINLSLSSLLFNIKSTVTCKCGQYYRYKLVYTCGLPRRWHSTNHKHIWINNPCKWFWMLIFLCWQDSLYIITSSLPSQKPCNVVRFSC